MKKILIIDDHIAVGLGTKAIISELEDVQVTLVSHEQEMNQMLMEQDFEVLLMDLHLPGRNGLELTTEIKRKKKETKIIIYTGLDIKSHYNACVKAGADGLVSKSSTSDQILLAVKAALNGQAIIPIELFQNLRLSHETKEQDGQEPLTERELDILLKLANGYTNQEIAEELFISQRSVERDLSSMYKKLNVSSRSEAVLKAIREKLIPELFIRS